MTLVYTGCPKNLTSLRRPINLAILIEITSNFHRMYRNRSKFYIKWKSTIRAYLSENLPERWIGLGEDKDSFSDEIATAITGHIPVWFLFMGICNETILCPLPLPASIDEPKQRITSALDNVTRDMLQRVWQELNNRLDVCRVTCRAHIEHL